MGGILVIDEKGINQDIIRQFGLQKKHIKRGISEIWFKERNIRRKTANFVEINGKNSKKY